MRRIAAALLLLLPMALAGPRDAAASVAPPSGPFSTWTFQGTCEDCEGFGTGTLVLSNYTPGTPLGSQYFYSFSYNSNLLSFSVPFYVIGSLQGVLTLAPGGDTVSYFTLSTPYIDNGVPTNGPMMFESGAGNWCVGNGCANDYGFANTWSTAAVPEPATLALLGMGLVGLASVRRRRG